ncbi:MAG: recombinase family protein [Ruminiclostridium sp.]
MRRKGKDKIIAPEYQKNCIIYARMSDEHKQNETSIDAQVRECKEFAEKHGLTVKAILQDRYSGTVADRAGFEEMKRLARAKPNFAYILVWRYDRFARNQQDTYAAMGYFGSYGINVISVKEQSGLEQTAQEKLLAGIYIAMAEYFSDELSIKVRRGMYEVSHRFESTGSTPLGYKVENKRYVIDEETAPIVREAFQLYGDEDKSISEIVSIFNSKGYKTSSGRPFATSSFESIFNNRKYIGIYSYASTNSNDEIEVVEQAGAIPRIVSDDLFNRVQERKARNKRTAASSKSKAEYLLTGRVYCGYCHGTISGESAHSHGNTHYYYSCYNYRKKKCSHRLRFERETLEKQVASEIVEYLSNEKYVDEMVRIICLDPMRDQMVAELEHLANKKKLIEKEGEKFFNAYMNSSGLIQKTLMDKYNNCMGEVSGIDVQIAAIQDKLNEPKLTEEIVRKHLKTALDSNITDKHARKILIDSFVHHIDVFDDKVDIILNTPDLLPADPKLAEAAKKSYYHAGDNEPFAEVEVKTAEEREEGELNYDALFHDSTLNELLYDFENNADNYDEPSKLSDFDMHRSNGEDDDDPDPDPKGPKPGAGVHHKSDSKKPQKPHNAVNGDKSGKNQSRSHSSGCGEPKPLKDEPIFILMNNGLFGFVIRLEGRRK